MLFANLTRNWLKRFASRKTLAREKPCEPSESCTARRHVYKLGQMNMNPRFDVFRKHTNNVIKWVGTSESEDGVEELIRSDSADANQDDYVVIHSAYGVTESRLASAAVRAK